MNPELEKYVSGAHQRGISDAQIRVELIKAGWNEANINQVIPPQTSPTSTPQQNIYPAPVVSPAATVPQGRRFPLWTTIIISIVAIVVILSGALYFMLGTDGIKGLFSQRQNMPSFNDEQSPMEGGLSPTGTRTETNSIDPADTGPSNSTTDNEQPSNLIASPTTEKQSNDCQSITDPAQQIRCFVNEVLETGNSTFCGQSNDPDFRSGCYIAAAAVKNSYPECKKTDSESQVFCILVVAAENGDSATCSKFDGPDNLGEMCHHYIQNPNENIMIDMAYLGRGIETKNLSDCYKIQYADLRNSCLEGVGN